MKFLDKLTKHQALHLLVGVLLYGISFGILSITTMDDSLIYGLSLFIVFLSAVIKEWHDEIKKEEGANISDINATCVGGCIGLIIELLLLI